jgi:signal transduction histidine kinase
VIGAAGLAVAALTITLGIRNDVPTIQIALLVWISVPYILAGLVAWWLRPDSRLGKLMVVGGFVTGISALQFSAHETLSTIGAAFDILPAALFLHVYLAFPDGRLRSQWERLLVGAAYVSAIGLQLLKMTLGAFPNLLDFWPHPDAARWVERLQLLSLSAMCVAGIVVLLVRRRRAGRPRRRALGLLVDSFALGLVMVAVLFVIAAFPEELGTAFRPVQRATLVVVGMSPVVFLIGLLDARLARSKVGELVLRLQGDPAPGDLRDAIAKALRDPSLALAYWLPHLEGYGDLDGQPVPLPPRDGRAVTPIDRNGQHVAVLIHDPGLEEERELLDAVGAAAGMALENARLQADLAAQLEEVKGSRLRAVEAGQEERKRLERNLHDGAQQRLVALSLQLKLLEKQIGEQPDARERLGEAQREVAMSLEELRDLARGIHPAIVTGHGLGVALEAVAARSPVPVTLDVELEDRVPEAIEVAAYYLVTESLTNVAKYASATAARVEITRAGDELVVEVVDDGCGGADSGAGSGLRGLADRVEALDGRLSVWSPQGGGTRVRAEFPCG